MRRMGFLGGSLIPRGGVLRGVGGGRGVGVGLFEEGGGWGVFLKGRLLAISFAYGSGNAVEL